MTDDVLCIQPGRWMETLKVIEHVCLVTLPASSVVAGHPDEAVGMSHYPQWRRLPRNLTLAGVVAANSS